MNEKVQETRQIQVKKLSAQTDDFDLKNTTPAERFGMMWQLTLDAWAFKGEPIAEPKLQRHIIRVLRRKG